MNDDWPLSCIDHGIVDCQDCGHWQEAQRDREEEYDRATASLRAERDHYRAALADLLPFARGNQFVADRIHEALDWRPEAA